MKVTKFRIPGEPPRGSKREAEYERMDQRLSEELMDQSRELEKKAKEENVGFPKEDAQAMLDRMLAMIHADPELNAKAQELIEVPDDAGEPCTQPTAVMTEPEAVEDEEKEELLRLGRALKASGKTLEDILGEETASGSGTAPLPSKEALKRKEGWRWKKPAKVFIGIAASLAMIVTVSISSNAMRMFWIEKLGWMFGNKPVTTVNNEEHFSEERDYTETEALDLIKNTIGIRPVYFRNMPESMTFSEVYVEESDQWAKMFYDYGDKSISILMDKSSTDMSFGVVYDGEELGTFKVDANGVEMIVHKIQRAPEHMAYYAEAEYENAYYSVIGDMEEDIFLDLMRNVAFW